LTIGLCRSDEVEDGAAKGFAIQHQGRLKRVLVVRRGEQLYAYLNRCPHDGTALDQVPGRFLDRAKQHLVCQAHGALFEIESGYCVDGPCAGESLAPLPVRVEGGMITLDD
jgi:nitrite reductase/ring-hydroxylating ferredoxin subunit